ncbi:UTP--glucose-1-phosphate uridylyltransferase [bacterium]|nr:UTP--glucose-1-phosphate uridylyltransferase [bacterium]
MNYSEAFKKLDKIGQTHLLKWYDTLKDEEKKILLDRISMIDEKVLSSNGSNKDKETISPLKTLTLDEIKTEEEIDRKKGLELLSKGKLGCVLLAGGMGSRLGYSHPKGMYNIGINKDKTIFKCQMETLKSRVKECGRMIPLFIMTSPENNEETIKHFEANNYYGYDKKYIKFFIQTEYPVTDMNGKILLTNKYTPATAPNGNGGWYISMVNANLDKYAKSIGIEYFNVYAVDNVLQKMADPVFLGAVVNRESECGAKVVRKVDVNEKVGVICMANGHPSITEYIELTDELRYSKDENGEYLYNFGVILNYLFRIDALDRTISNEFPIYRANKKFPYMDDNGNFIVPTENNANKYETYVLDMIRMMNDCVSFEVDRNKEFAPVKNLHGIDSVDSARELLTKNGIEI